jgi:HSP20 family protein
MILAPFYYDSASSQHPLCRPSYHRVRRPITMYIVRANQNPPVKDESQDKEEKKDERSEGSTAVVYQKQGVQVSEDKSNYTLSLDLPGVNISDAQVEMLDGGTLRIQTERTTGEAIKSIHHFAFNETTIDTSNIQANLRDGVLSITIPKKEKVMLEPIDVTVTSGHAPKEENPNKTSLFSIDIPGIAAKDVKVKFHEGKFAVQAERRRGENTLAKIHRTFAINAKKVDTTQFEAFLADGVLEVVAPEKQAAAPLSVAITTNEVLTESEVKENCAETVSQAEAAEDEAAWSLISQDVAVTKAE